MKQWIVPVKTEGGAEMKAQFGDFFGELLFRRGISTAEAAKEFFNRNTLSDPFEMRDMQAAADTILDAVNNDLKITVFGDYDCDGVTAAAMLYSYLEAMGADVDIYIPERSEGYGLNIPALKKIIAGGTQLIITVDNGISAAKEAAFVRENGVKLVITDHHQPPPVLPDCDACVNPQRADDTSGLTYLCGAGVVLKLLCALGEDEEFIMEQYADLAAVGIVGDVVPLKGENRIMVRRGLQSMREGQNLGLARLMSCAGVPAEKVSATTLAYTICPRINAAGRMSSASKAAQLLLSDAPQSAQSLAEELSMLNDERKAIEKRIMDEIEQALADDPSILRQRVIVLEGAGWHAGVIGLACSKIVEKYDKPVVIMSVEDGEARGSARSVDGFSIHKMLEVCAAPLTKYGGHPKAGGFSLPADKTGEFKALIHAFAREYYPKMPTAKTYIDMETDCAALTVENVELLSHIEPFGEGNKQPLFLLRGCEIVSKRALKDGLYTSFEARSGGAVLKALCFKTPFARFFPKEGDRLDIVAAAEINVYKGEKSVALRVNEFRPHDFREDKFFAASRVYEEISRGEGCDKRLLPRVVPQNREELIKIYDMVRKHGGNMSAGEMAQYIGGVNYCMLRITLDAFAEAGMIKLSANAASSEIVPNAPKQDLFASGLLKRIIDENKG